jgi:hypothetical protein
LRLIYDGVVYKDGLTAPYKPVEATWLTTNDDFWVMSVTQNIGANGEQLQLEISNVDRYQQNAAEIIVGMVESIEINNIGVQPYPQQRSWNHKAPIDESTPVEFSFRIFDDVLRLVAVKAFIYRSVWTAVAGTADDSGDHKHKVATHVTTDTTNAPCAVDAGTHVGNAVLVQAEYRYAIDDNPASSSTFSMNIVVGDGSQDDWYTEGNSGTHTHPTEFSGVQQDTLLPEDCSLVVNGELVSSTLFPEPTGNDYEEIDITDEVLNKVGGFRGWHDITIDCGTNRGDLTVTLYIDCEVGTVRAN